MKYILSAFFGFALGFLFLTLAEPDSTGHDKFLFGLFGAMALAGIEVAVRLILWGKKTAPAVIDWAKAPKQINLVIKVEDNQPKS